MTKFKLLTAANANPKLAKSAKENYMNFGLHLAPYTLAGHRNVCPKATQGCIKACLNLAGHGGMLNKQSGTNTIQQARIRRTQMFFNDRDGFLNLLIKDINHAIKYATKKGFKAAIRLNLTSDISWEKYKINGKTIFETFPNTQFYDYSKILGRKTLNIPNYHLTFSRAENNDADVLKAKDEGYNIAVVFKGPLPETYLGLKVIDGDITDLRFMDPAQCVVGLKAKGPAKKDTSGFVVHV